MITDEQIEIAVDNIAKEFLSRGLTAAQAVEHLRDEVDRVEAELNAHKITPFPKP